MDENALTKKPHCTQPEGRRLLSSGAARTFGFCQHMLLLRDEGRYVATFYDANEIQQRLHLLFRREVHSTRDEILATFVINLEINH